MSTARKDRISLILRPFLATQPRALLLGALLAAITVLTGMALLGLSGWFITATALAGANVATAFMFDVFMPSAGIRLLAVGRTASRYGERLVTHDATFAVLAALRVQLFRGWARAGAARELLMRPSRVLFRLTSDIDALESLYLRLVVPAIAALGAAVLAGVVLGFMHIGLGIALAVWLVASGWGIAFVVARRARRPSVQRAHAIEVLRARAVDLVAGQSDLIMAGRIDTQKVVLADADRRLAAADLALNRLEANVGAAYGMAGTISLVTVLLAVGALVGEGRIGAPAAALALLVALTAVEPFSAMRRGALDAGRTWLAVRRLAPRMALDDVQSARFSSDSIAPIGAELSAAAAAASLTSGIALRFHEITAAHSRAGSAVLHGVSLRIDVGERVALIGPSGAGKSTLLAIAAGELTPRSGTVATLPACLLTQRTELFQDSLRDNLRLADSSADDARLWRALEAAGLAHDIRATAAGLDTRLGEGGLGLSGGQSRRLALARLLLRPTDFWLLDEPTEALDTDIARDVLQRLAQHAGPRTVLIATHLRREAALADRLVRMEAGHIVADLRRGTPGFEAALRALRPD
ncbi:amino acid ABC transporter ATP-binding/permease protein [Variovorax sp. LG9.2]|uniref:amino acid ABC transporter ATP-binding/permease protein n=1 Tax=Variovorax sp. LG9.2 TaxID=3048626 RepID=UPI002B23ACBE|nr:ATP-binding cassette domain-containing protein [Variovorax sp. LG9.2]MEB0059818.1 ATP-binding cassette domain-containing protein [Variovorax sp. LG9.2]